MGDANTTAAVEQYLLDLAAVRGDSPAEPVVRAPWPGPSIGFAFCARHFFTRATRG